MAIKGYTDKNGSLPKILDIRKGAKKTDPNKPGADLDYFRVVGDTETMRRFAELFGDKPQAIEFISPYNTTAETFEAWKEEWAAGGLKHRCDGEKTVRRQLQNGTYTDDPIDCPGGCKQAGRLNIVVHGLNRFGLATVHTTSIWDIISISQQLTMLETLRGSLRGIPLILRRVKRAISTPSGTNGQRSRREKWLLTVEPSPKWVEMQLEAMERAALPSVNEPLMLTAGDMIRPEPDEENDEFELMCDAETQRAIETLWPEHGVRYKNGEVMPIAQFLNSKNISGGIQNLPLDLAQKTLAFLQDNALKAQHPEPPKAEPGAGLDQWECKDRNLALAIITFTKDLEELGVSEDVWRDELCETIGVPRGSGISRKALNPEQARGWCEFLKTWIKSKREALAAETA